MLHLLLYGVLAVVVGGVLFAAAARFLPAGEQIAPPVRDEPPWELPPDRTLLAADVDAVRLPVALRGYRFAETDQLLDRLAGELRARDAELARLRGDLPVDEEPPADELAPVGEQLPFDEAARDEPVADEVAADEVSADEVSADDDAAQFGAVVLVKSAAAIEEETGAGDEAVPEEPAAAPAEDDVAPVEAPVEVPVDHEAAAEEPALGDEDVSIDELFAPTAQEAVGEQVTAPPDEVATPAAEEATAEPPTAAESVPPQPLVLHPPEFEQVEPADAPATNDELDAAFPLPARKRSGRRRRARHAAEPAVEEEPAEVAATPAEDVPPVEAVEPAEEVAPPEAPPDLATPGSDDELADSLAVNEALEESAAPPPNAPPPAQFEPPTWSPATQHSGHWTVSAPPWAVAPAPGLQQAASPDTPPPAVPPAGPSPADQPAAAPKGRRRRRRRS